MHFSVGLLVLKLSLVLAFFKASSFHNFYCPLVSPKMLKMSSFSLSYLSPSFQGSFSSPLDLFSKEYLLKGKYPKARLSTYPVKSLVAAKCSSFLVPGVLIAALNYFQGDIFPFLRFCLFLLFSVLFSTFLS